MSFPAWTGCYGCGKVNNRENPNRLKALNYENRRTVAMCADCMPQYNAVYTSAMLIALLENLGLDNQIDYETIADCHAFVPELEMYLNKK